MLKKILVAGAILGFVLMTTQKSSAINLGADTKNFAFKGVSIGAAIEKNYKQSWKGFQLSDLTFGVGIGFDIRNVELTVTPIKLKLGTGDQRQYNYEASLKVWFK